MTGGQAPARLDVWNTIVDRALESDGGERGIDVWARLKQLVDPGEFRPKLAPDIEFKYHQLKWNNSYVVVGNPRDLIHYRLEPRDVELVKMMDGTRTVKEIVIERFQDSGEVELEAVADIVKMLYEGNFLERRYLNTDEALKRAMDPVSTARKKARIFAKTLSIEWMGANKLVKWLYDHGLKYFFRRWVQVLMAIVSVAGVAAFIAVARDQKFALAGKSLAIAFLILLVLDYFMVFIHELGHALVIVHAGRRIKSAGFQIYYGSPAFFVDSSDGLMLDRKTQMVESFAGPYAQMIVAAIASFIALLFPEWALSETLYKYAVLNYIVILMNLIPLLELDGYWLLADAIQVPDLRPRSFGFVRHDLWHKARTRGEKLTKQEWGLTLYAFLGTAFTIFSFYTSYFYWKTIFGGLVIRLWNGGLVTRVILVALAVFVLGPAVRGLIKLVKTLMKRVRDAYRRVKFRFEMKWRVEAAEMIDALPIFPEIPVDVLNDLAGRVKLRQLAKGAAVFRQGDEANAFYVVRSGSVNIVEEDPSSGTERVIRTLTKGQSFGELALVMEADRSATVRAAEDTQLFEIDLSTFDRLLSELIQLPDFQPTLQQAAELRQHPSFASLESDRLAELLEHGEWVNFGAGEVLMEQGEVGDAFFAIGSGQVQVIRDEEEVAMLGAGDYVGEIALLFDVPRTATVVAYTPVRAFRLDRAGFDKLVAGSFRRGTLKPNAEAARTKEH